MRLPAAAGWTLAYLGIAGLLEFFVVSVPYDADMAYHVAVGRLIREHGILHSFPWTPFSWLADHYADKELLYHLLIVPFAGLSWITAAKTVSTLVGAALLVALHAILRAEQVRGAGLWAALPLITSSVFLFRFAIGRPFLLSITLTCVILWAASRKKLMTLAVACAIFPWVYVAWPLALALVCLAESARLLSGSRTGWKTMAAAFLGLAAGVALHPNVSNLLRLTWIGIVDVLFRNTWGARAGIEMGRELAPLTPAQWAMWLLAPAAMTAASLGIAWRHRRTDAVALTFAIAALVFGVLTARTSKFVEYFVPLSVAALALASRSISWRGFLPATLVVTLAYAAVPLSTTLHRLHAREERLPPALATQLRAAIPSGAQVFTTEWWHTGTLMLALPERRFIVALDPTFFLVQDPELYALWYRLPRSAPRDAAAIIRGSFRARYVLSFREERWQPFYVRLASDPSVRTLLVADRWMLFDLGSAPR